MTLRKGFTLVEVIIVIVVIVILTTIATFGINKYLADSRDAQRVASSTTIADSLEKYYDANGLFWAIDEAMRFYKRDPGVRYTQISRIMNESSRNFTHEKTARQYKKLYETMLQRPLL